MMQPFSIIIPTWKNIPFLDLCYRSLRENSAVNHEIFIFFNEFDESAEQWVQGKDVRFEQNEKNIGICEAVNSAARQVSHDFICYFNDDMYALPGWDTALEPYLHISDKLWLSSTAIERGPSTPCYIGNHDYGSSPENFREQDLLREYHGLKRPYNMVSTWTPTVIPRKNWEAVGGFDEAYFPGYGSDPDLAMKMYRDGCRHFIGVGTSLVYHFGKQTTSRYDKPGTDIMDSHGYFKKKWGVARSKFLKKTLRRDEIITPDLLKKMHKR
jgi:GT2 family glycosyltransferase